MSEFPALAEVVDLVTDSQSPLRYRGGSGLARLGRNVAKAWRDACTITTVEQLRAISPTPESLSGALIKSFGDGLGGVLELNDDGTWNDYDRADGERIDAAEVHLPALLIWHPDWSKP